VVRINDSLYEAAREKIERQAAQSGFEGPASNPGRAGDLQPATAGSEWADGGVVLERAAIGSQINELVRALYGVPRSGRKAMRTEP